MKAARLAPAFWCQGPLGAPRFRTGGGGVVLARRALTLMHRCLGLTMAGFLIVSGLTGAVISWDHELDEWLNPHLLNAKSQGTALPSMTLAGKQSKNRFPEVQVTYFENAAEPGHSQYFLVEPRGEPCHRTNSTRQISTRVYMDPCDRPDLLGVREWGAFWPLSREDVRLFPVRVPLQPTRP